MQPDAVVSIDLLAITLTMPAVCHSDQSRSLSHTLHNETLSYHLPFSQLWSWLVSIIGFV